MGKYDPMAEQSAAAEHQRRLGAPVSPVEEIQADEGLADGGALLDGLAGVMRRRGISADLAMLCAMDLKEIYQRMDRALCGDELTISAEEARELDALQVASAGAHGVARERLLEALSQVWAWPDARKGVGAMFFALGAPLYGCNSMRELARLRGVSVEDVSNVVDELQRLLGVPRNAMQKSAEAVKSYQRECGAAARATKE